MNQDQIEKHTTIQSLFWHLLPGILVGGFYFLALQPVTQMGYPSIFALLLAFACVLVPFELGVLLVQGKKRSGRFSLKWILGLQKSIPWWQYLLWPTILFLVTGAIFSLLEPVDSFFLKRLFFWMPSVNYGLDGNYSRAVLISTYTLFLFFNVFLAPIVEEFYFRGYLLPRMPGRFAPLLHSFLFAAVHFFTPWMVLTRTLGLLPLLYGVKKKNIYVGMIIHILGNSVSFVAGIVFILRMAS